MERGTGRPGWSPRIRFVEEGLGAALVHRKPKNTKPKKLDGSQEAHLIALACSEPPKGKKRWSARQGEEEKTA